MGQERLVFAVEAAFVDEKRPPVKSLGQAQSKYGKHLSGCPQRHPQELRGEELGHHEQPALVAHPEHQGARILERLAQVVVEHLGKALVGFAEGGRFNWGIRDSTGAYASHAARPKGGCSRACSSRRLPVPSQAMRQSQ
jgi:hypothetical protein